MMTISVAQLRQLFERLLEQLAADGVREIPLDEDYYWMILPPNAYDFDAIPAPAVGSLLDDCTELRKVIADPTRFTYLDADRLAALLQYISERQMPG